MLLFRVLIPANTFQDLEDGDTRDLSLRVVDRDTGRDLQQLAWATFQPSTQEILALPTEENIGIYNLQVVATDSGRGITQDAGGGHAAASPLPCLPPRARHGGAQQLAARHGLEAQRAPDPRQLLQATSTRAASPSSSWPRRAPARSGSAGTTTRCRGSPAPRRTSSRSTTP